MLAVWCKIPKWEQLKSSLVITHSLSHYNASQAKSIFILAGQSNMAGRGGIMGDDTWDGYIPPQCRSNPLIFRLNAGLTWEEAQEPLHRDIDVTKTCGVGPGMAFSNAVLNRESGIGVIGLVPCAVGGTNISEWKRGSGLYNQMLSRVQAALRGGGGIIRAILWYQGESDTISHENAKLYRQRLEKFLTEIRSDLLSPFLPVIQVALASGQGHYVYVIRKAQLGIELPNVKCVDAKGLQLQPDGLHLSTAAQVELGQKMADAFLQIMAPLPVQSSGGPKRLNTFSWISFLDGLGREIFLRIVGYVSINY
ncbi:probable carbohydrate esterase at4g34215 [Phtheirospermum japonicum]|uniref:Probable carbohydrate esterase at4g34215 n=1 Tax=Phtheirospermum japonicum TaxID=374723 RepID=A0A830BBW8_9LAMI|nr:probable carbohydrate esterase at4g34215 [Phtheirospermum japonicum]